MTDKERLALIDKATDVKQNLIAGLEPDGTPSAHDDDDETEEPSET